MLFVFLDIQEYYETLLTFIDENKPMEEIEMESREVAKKWENVPVDYTDAQVRMASINNSPYSVRCQCEM